MSRADDDRGGVFDREQGPDGPGPADAAPLETLRQALVTGTAVVVPVILTLVVLSFVLDFIYARIDLFSDFLIGIGFDAVTTEFILNVLTPVILLAVVVGVGLAVEWSQSGERLVDYFDYALSHVPGVGAIYESFRKMSDAVMESDVENFREVKLVEFPHEGAYTLGFVTTRTPEQIRSPTRHDDMLTLFLPLAPNPVMGGHLVHVPEDDVMDVDMTVEEGMRTILTTGVAVGDVEGAEGLSREELEALAGRDTPVRGGDDERGPDGERR